MVEIIQIRSNNKKKLLLLWKYLKISTLIIIPILLILLPIDFFDKGKSIGLFAIIGLEDYVYSTGMTRAIMHLIHFDIEGALFYNKLSFFVLPLLITLWLKQLLKEFGIKFLKWF